MSMLLEVKDVSRSYRSGTAQLYAVQDVSLRLERGETLGLVGESGCGKSTLARLITGLEPPSSGAILLDGQPAHSKGAGAGGRIQMVFQDPWSSLNPRLKIGTSLAEPLQHGNLSRARKKIFVEEMLRTVGLDASHSQRYPHEFSGGQRQRLAIARALITQPDIVVCDEAVSALDASVQAHVLNLLNELKDRFEPAYLFISHNLSVVGYMSDRVLVMYLGRLVEKARRDDLFNKPAHPYTRALLACAPSQNHRMRRTHPALEGELPSPLNPPSGCPFHPRCTQVMSVCQQTAPEWHTIGHSHRVCCHLYA